MKPAHILLFLVPAVAALACSKQEELPSTNAPLRTCVPNQVLVCLCGLDEGTQRCTEDQELTPCECASKQTGDAGASLPTPIKSSCGDGKVDPGEACDDGNTTDGDGCSSSCKPDGAPARADACPGQALTLWKGSSLVLSGTTEGYSNKVPASCRVSDGPDRVYRLQPKADGILSVDAAFSPGFFAIVDIRRDRCTAAAASIMCEETASEPFKRVLQVEKDKSYFLIIDGELATDQGAYTIRLELP